MHALYEMVEENFRKFFDVLKLLNEQFLREKDSADILRLALLQLNVRHLSDLEVVAVEDSYAKTRLESLLSVMNGKVQDYEFIIRTELASNSNMEAAAEEDEEEDDEEENENEEEDNDDAAEEAEEVEENEEEDNMEEEDIEEDDDNEEDD